MSRPSPLLINPSRTARLAPPQHDEGEDNHKDYDNNNKKSNLHRPAILETPSDSFCKQPAAQARPAGTLAPVTDAALPLEPKGPEFVVGARLTESDREIIWEWLKSGEFEETLLQLDIEDLEIQRRDLEYKLRARDEARLPSTE